MLTFKNANNVAESMEQIFNKHYMTVTGPSVFYVI